MKRAAALALFVAGAVACSGDDDDNAPPDDVADASADAARDGSSAAPDGGGASEGGGGTACSPTEPFLTITRLFEDDGVGRLAPTLTGDELDLAFVSKADLVGSKSAAGAWGPSTTLAVSASGQEERDPSFSADGLDLFFVRGTQLVAASRAARADAFVTATDVKLTDDTPSAPRSPVVLDSALYFTDTDGDATYRVYRAAANGGTFAKPERVQVGGTDLVSDKIALDAAETVMYFARPVSNVLQIFVTERANATGAWGPPVALKGLLLGGDQRPGWSSPDQCRLYLTVTSTENVNALFVASRR